ncbi:hydrophobic protein [Musa troglodytarum]|uniref:Hydrophobic protein n=1 Tax=Musa troglodytarum TaxID=320322 RepID=A0A9E7JXD2_9LILI|nr:hydrophobic protein [Musa troglodytarum]
MFLEVLLQSSSPPLGVFLHYDCCSLEFCICFLLPILGYVPGTIYAIYVLVAVHRQPYRREGLLRAPCLSSTVRSAFFSFHIKDRLFAAFCNLLRATAIICCSYSLDSNAHHTVLSFCCIYQSPASCLPINLPTL